MDVKNPKEFFLARANSVKLLEFFGYCVIEYLILCAIFEPNMAPTQAVPGLLFQTMCGHGMELIYTTNNNKTL